MNCLHRDDFTTMTLNGHCFSGWADGDAITLPENVNLIQTTRDDDGLLSPSITHRQGGQVVLRLAPKTLSVYHLHNALAKQRQFGYAMWDGEISFDHGRIALVNGILTTAPFAPVSRASLKYIFEFETIFYERR